MTDEKNTLPGTMTESHFTHAVTDDGRRRVSAATTKHGAGAAISRIQSGQPFIGLALERQNQAIERMALNPEAGGVLGEIDTDLSRITAVCDLCWEATLSKAAAGDIKGYFFYVGWLTRLVDKKAALMQRRAELLAADRTIDVGSVLDG